MKLMNLKRECEYETGQVAFFISLLARVIF